MIECCEKRVGARLASQELYDAYRMYATRNGEYVRRITEFSPALKQAGYQQVNHSGRMYWIDIALL